MKAHDICQKAATLVSGDRQLTYGDPYGQHHAAARLWNAYIAGKYKQTSVLTAEDVCQLMILLKMSRAMGGVVHPDNYVDQAGYSGLAGYCAEKAKDVRNP